MVTSSVKKLEVTEMKMCGVDGCYHTLRDNVRNDNIRKRLAVQYITVQEWKHCTVASISIEHSPTKCT